MPLPPYVLIPLGTAFLYAVAAVMLKRAMQDGASPWRINFVCNWIAALAFLPLWTLGDGRFEWIHIIHACTAGLTFFGGQLFTFIALNRSDVSVATPILGSKVIFVAAFSTVLLPGHVPPQWWIAVGLTLFATLMLRGQPTDPGRPSAAGIAFGFLAAASFAMTDILIQKWAALWSFGHFVPTMFLTVALLSLTLLPVAGGLRPASWRWLLPGALLLALQGLGMAFTFTKFGHATAVNVVYNSRGIWSVVLVWTVGHWFANAERHRGAKIMGRRLVAAALVVTAIWLVRN